jgi:hypothetical protein
MVLQDRLGTYQYSAPSERRGADLAVGALADHVQLALEGELVFQRRIAADEHLTDERLAQVASFTQALVIGGHRAPAEYRLALRLHDLLEAFFELAALAGIARQEDQSAAVLARRRQGDSRHAHHACRKRCGICSRTPAPSPVLTSQPHAPR